MVYNNINQYRLILFATRGFLKMSKKLISLLLAVCMLFCLSACGTTQTDSNPTNTPSESQTESENNNVSTNDEISTNNDTTQEQKPSNQSKPTSTTNQTTHTHSYSNATCTSPKKCSCGATAGTALGHQFSSATCTSPKICSRCGTTSGNALGHSYSAANCNSPKTCTRCGQTSGGALGHNYVNNKCSRCGKVDPDSLPVGLDKLVVIDCKSDFVSRYKYDKGALTDSFGRNYMGYHYFPAWPDMYAIYHLDSKYSKLSLDIVATDSMESGAEATIGIYVDDVLKYSKSNFLRTTGKVHVDLDVKNGEKLEIKVTSTSNGDKCARVAIVNAQLTK